MKLGFLFGAGAEIDYGLPTGGKFALDIFREDISPSKREFIEMRDSIEDISSYASLWLPEDYRTRSVSSYGKTVIENIIKDTIEHKRENIIQNINNFDKFAETEKKNSFENIDSIIENLLNKSINECRFNTLVSFNKALKDGNEIFKSKYFSAFLLLYKKNILEDKLNRELGKIIISILQLQIGALGAKLTKDINDNLFDKKDEEIDIFDNIGEVLRLNYQSAGAIGIEYLYDNVSIDIEDETENSPKIVCFARNILESIFSSVLDYKSLIDSNWHYLYCPKNEWAKFCKISIFLLTVKNYIMNQAPKELNCKSYYDDLIVNLEEKKIETSKIATTNYNNIIEQKLKYNDVIYLNGSVNQWYDPYLNKIDKKENLKNKFIVPLIFTQSGTKPMTSISKSCEYVDLYREWEKSDYIVVVGFGFNQDDEHINGIIRTLIEDSDKKVIVIGKNSDEHYIAEKLKITKYRNIKVLNVDKNRNYENKLWIDYIKDISF